VRLGGKVEVGETVGVGVIVAVLDGCGLNVGLEVAVNVCVWEGDGEGVIDGVETVAGMKVGIVWVWGERARMERKMVKANTKMVSNA
jgi:hypothetical protein